MIDHIHNEAKFNQIVSFEGIGEGNHRPSDIDGFFDYKGEVFVFLECKTKGNEMSIGQRRGLEYLLKAISKPAILIIFEHETPEDEHVLAVNCKVQKFLYKGLYYPYDKTVGQLIEHFIAQNYENTNT